MFSVTPNTIFSLHTQNNHTRPDLVLLRYYTTVHISGLQHVWKAKPCQTLNDMSFTFLMANLVCHTLAYKQIN